MSKLAVLAYSRQDDGANDNHVDCNRAAVAPHFVLDFVVPSLTPVNAVEAGPRHGVLVASLARLRSGVLALHS